MLSDVEAERVPVCPEPEATETLPREAVLPRHKVVAGQLCVWHAQGTFWCSGHRRRHRPQGWCPRWLVGILVRSIIPGSDLLCSKGRSSSRVLGGEACCLADLVGTRGGRTSRPSFPHVPRPASSPPRLGEQSGRLQDSHSLPLPPISSYSCLALLQDSHMVLIFCGTSSLLPD